MANRRSSAGRAALHPFAGILRLLAEAIADKILKEREGVFLVSEDPARSPGAARPASVQEKGNEESSGNNAEPHS